MAEYTANAIQTVASNQNILFTSTPVSGNRCIQHREGSGLFTLRGITNQNSARYLIDFSGNIAVPTGGTAGAISIAIAISGEADNASTMIVTPAAVDEYFNVSSGIYVTVPKGCCVTISVENISTQSISVQNANLIVTRVA